MRKKRFIGRRGELGLLNRIWSSSDSELLVLYGRRRVGKTRLLTHWMETGGVRALYWVAAPTSAHDQLRSFSQVLYNFANPDTPAPADFSYADWEQAFRQAGRLTEEKRLALILDEFTYVMAVEPGIAGILQSIWDAYFSEINLVLVVAGSHIGMMERELISYQAPLYGRATMLLNLQPLPFADTQSFFPDYSATDRVSVYAMLGGIPAYWERFRPNQTLDENMRREFLEANRLFQDEPRLLLHDFVSEGHNYVTILQAIANGYRMPTEIGNYAGLEKTHVAMYLSRLVQSGFVERRVPLTAAAVTRLGRHHITDPFLRFYYRFLSQRQAQLALGVQELALKEIKKHLIDFVGTHTWEELSREWLLRAGGKGKREAIPDRVGGIWTRQVQVDVVGINEMEKTLTLGECKWGAKAVGHTVLRELVEKTAAIVPPQGQWRVDYVGFARGGWTTRARSYAAELSKEKVSGANWVTEGIHLLDLTQVDQDLWEWTQ
jgi:hypothetical protein